MWFLAVSFSKRSIPIFVCICICYETSQPLHFIKITIFFLRGDESDYSEDDLNMNRSDESGSSASRVEPEPVMTIYQEDSLVEQFGSSTDQTEEFSDENKSIVWFLVKQVSILFIGFFFVISQIIPSNYCIRFPSWLVGASRHGPFASNLAYVHLRAPVLLRKDLRLLLPFWLYLRVSTYSSMYLNYVFRQEMTTYM